MPSKHPNQLSRGGHVPGDHLVGRGCSVRFYRPAPAAAAVSKHSFTSSDGELVAADAAGTGKRGDEGPAGFCLGEPWNESAMPVGADRVP